MLPWLAHGHISPFLELAKKLTTRNFHIFFCSTPINLGPIKQKNSIFHLCLSFLHTTTQPGLTLPLAFDMASPNFSTILKKLKPDLVVYDFLQPWAPLVAMSQNIPAVQFLTMSATMQSFVLHVTNNAGVEFPEIYLRDYEISKFTNLLESSANDIKDKDRVQECFERSSEIEPSSSVFISFGSEYFLSKEKLQEIAHGLELSMVSFIWVVRFPRGDKVNLQTVLPKGFLERVILKHSSIGGFVSHCGWSSVMESMKFGVPIIAMPMHLDQPVNARLVEELGVGVEVKRDMNGRLEGEELAKVIRKVVVEKITEGIRRKGSEFKENIRSKGDEEIDGVVKKLVQLCRNKNRD
ncbi:hypothetical protein ACB092_11G141200 [Castanea dentata]